MSFEIERKFLVRGDDWQELATSRTSIRQAYLSSNSKASIRVRIKGDHTATLSIKSRPVDLRRLELEYAIPVLEAEALMQLRQGAAIEKVRHVIPHGDLAWEVDVFEGENDGLVIAESCATSISASSYRPGSAPKSPGSSNTTTAPWCSARSVPGRAGTRRWRASGWRDG
jgi:adenylate cyclase